MQPFFLDGSAGPLFAIYFPPDDAAPRRGNVLFVPPFAEEMNRARRMAALQARALARIGVGTLLLDLGGTGDSAGEFGDARWETWLGDVAAATDWLAENRQGRIGLWGLRLGGALAMEALSRRPEAYDRAVLWQPVTSGEMHLVQFLRIRVAAAMGREDEEGGSTEVLRAALARSESVEVAGYELNPALAAALEGRKLADYAPPPGIRVDWLEIVGRPDRPLSPGSQRLLDDWRGRGVDIRAETVPGHPFWALQEITVAPELVDATCRVVAEGWP